jgi:hypothetical protein
LAEKHRVSSTWKEKKEYPFVGRVRQEVFLIHLTAGLPKRGLFMKRRCSMVVPDHRYHWVFMTLVIIGLLGVATLSVHIPTASAQATATHPYSNGGGCQNSFDQKVGACISISGSTLIANAYINPQGSIPNCTVRIRIFDLTTDGIISENWFTCTGNNPHGPITAPAISGRSYSSTAYVPQTGSEANSPTLNAFF